MTHYIHHVPGRMRVRSPRIKGNRDNAERLRQTLVQLIGVTGIETNPVTGSVVISYCPERLGPDDLVAVMKEDGYLDPDFVLDGQRSGQAAQGAAPPEVALHWVGKTVLTVLVEKLVERSASAVFTALI
jgi:hypothetical protein